MDSSVLRLHDIPPQVMNEPNFSIDVSSEHTPINFPSRKDSFILENDLTNTVADHLPQRFVASSSQCSAGSTIPTLLNSGSVRSTGDLVRGNNSVASVEEPVLRGKRDRDSNSVRTSSDRRNLQKYLERKAESAVRRENAAQKRLS